MQENIKLCSRCKCSYPATDEYFHRNSANPDGLRYDCKVCQNQRKAIYRRLHKKELTRKELQRYYASREDPERYAKTLLAKQEERERSRPMRRLRRALCMTMRARIYEALKHKKARSPWQGLVGYTVDELRAYLETKFQEGMTWDNHGEWHIDHIRPISSFSFTSSDDDEFKQCWALENLQPLWAKDNLSKKRGYT